MFSLSLRLRLLWIARKQILTFCSLRIILFISRCSFCKVCVWGRVFHFSLRFITFGSRSAHLAYHVHKSGPKTSIIIIHMNIH